MAKYIEQVAGRFQEKSGTAVSTGVADADKIPQLDGSGRFDPSLMPTGIGADTAVIQASEALAAGDFINIHNASGAARVRKADASASGKEAHGFVISTFAAAANATVYFEGTNAQVTGQTPGPVFLSPTTAGQATGTAPITAGQTVQSIGLATSPTSINFHYLPPILLA